MKNATKTKRFAYTFTQYQYDYLIYLCNDNDEMMKNIVYAIFTSNLTGDIAPIMNLTKREKEIYKEWGEKTTDILLKTKRNGKTGGAKKGNTNAMSKKTKRWTTSNQAELTKAKSLFLELYKRYKNGEKEKHKNHKETEIYYKLTGKDQIYILNTFKTKLSENKLTNKYIKAFIDTLPTIEKLKNSNYAKGKGQTPYDYMQYINDKYSYIELSKRQHSNFISEKIY